MLQQVTGQIPFAILLRSPGAICSTVSVSSGCVQKTGLQSIFPHIGTTADGTESTSAFLHDFTCPVFLVKSL